MEEKLNEEIIKNAPKLALWVGEDKGGYSIYISNKWSGLLILLIFLDEFKWKNSIVYTMIML